jgi:hypothetical protein
VTFPFSPFRTTRLTTESVLIIDQINYWK